MSAQSARDKLFSKIKVSASEDLPQMLDNVKSSYEGVRSDTKEYVLVNEAFEVGDTSVCDVAFLQVEESENKHSVRHIIYSLNLADIDSEVSWRSGGMKGVLTIPMARGKKVFAEAYVADRKIKEAMISAFDMASPDDSDKLIINLKQLANYCRN